MNYTVTAKLNGSTSRIGFSASNDSEATFEAINLILTKAISSKVWAKGHITLRNSEGEIIHEMGAK